MNKRKVRSIFSNMRLYEARNVIFSFGQNLVWRREVVKLAEGKLLDVATGPGIIPRIYRKGFSIGLDISIEMVKRGKGRSLLVVGDAEELPFKNASFDSLSIAFGLRNIENKYRALREFYRVLKPGGRLLILEMKVSSGDLPNFLYLIFMIFFAPIVLGKITDYMYLLKSMLKFPSDEDMRVMLVKTGFKSVAVKRFVLGPARIFIGIK